MKIVLFVFIISILNLFSSQYSDAQKVHLEAQKALIWEDYKVAIPLLRKACDGDNSACFNLGTLYETGEGVKQDYMKAKTLYIKACDGGYFNGCFNLGIMYYSGRGVKKDYMKAKAFFGKACSYGDAEGCKNFNIIK